MDAIVVQLADEHRQLRFVLERSNAFQHRLQRGRPLGVDAGLVHAGVVIVADLLVVGRTAGIVGRGLIENIAQDQLIAFVQFVEPAPFRLVRRNGIVLDPVAAGVLVEIDARVGGLVHRIQVEAGDVLNLLSGGAGLALRLRRDSGKQQNASYKREMSHV